MRGELKTLLENDVALMGILTGGVYDRGEISRQDSPGAFNAVGEILPCCLITLSARTPNTSDIPGASDQYLTIYFYQQVGYSSIDAAMDRVFELLDHQRLELPSGFNYEIVHANNLGDSYDDALSCSMNFSRYKAVVKR